MASLCVPAFRASVLPPCIHPCLLYGTWSHGPHQHTSCTRHLQIVPRSDPATYPLHPLHLACPFPIRILHPLLQPLSAQFQPHLNISTTPLLHLTDLDQQTMRVLKRLHVPWRWYPAWLALQRTSHFRGMVSFITESCIIGLARVTSIKLVIVTPSDDNSIKMPMTFRKQLLTVHFYL
jgi:hypothetical protein